VRLHYGVIGYLSVIMSFDMALFYGHCNTVGGYVRYRANGQFVGGIILTERPGAHDDFDVFVLEAKTAPPEVGAAPAVPAGAHVEPGTIVAVKHAHLSDVTLLWNALLPSPWARTASFCMAETPISSYDAWRSELSAHTADVVQSSSPRARLFVEHLRAWHVDPDPDPDGASRYNTVDTVAVAYGWYATATHAELALLRSAGVPRNYHRPRVDATLSMVSKVLNHGPADSIPAWTCPACTYANLPRAGACGRCKETYDAHAGGGAAAKRAKGVKVPRAQGIHAEQLAHNVHSHLKRPDEPHWSLLPFNWSAFYTNASKWGTRALIDVAGRLLMVAVQSNVQAAVKARPALTALSFRYATPRHLTELLAVAWPKLYEDRFLWSLGNAYKFLQSCLSTMVDNCAEWALISQVVVINGLHAPASSIAGPPSYLVEVSAMLDRADQSYGESLFRDITIAVVPGEERPINVGQSTTNRVRIDMYLLRWYYTRYAKAIRAKRTEEEARILAQLAYDKLVSYKVDWDCDQCGQTNVSWDLPCQNTEYHADYAPALPRPPVYAPKLLFRRIDYPTGQLRIPQLYEQFHVPNAVATAFFKGLLKHVRANAVPPFTAATFTRFPGIVGVLKALHASEAGTATAYRTKKAGGAAAFGGGASGGGGGGAAAFGGGASGGGGGGGTCDRCHKISPPGDGPCPCTSVVHLTTRMNLLF